MKIAILTLPFNVNYGGILQAYALQSVLERSGHEVEVLDIAYYKTKISCLMRVNLFFRRLLKRYILKRESAFYAWKTEREIVWQYTDAFVNKYINLRKIKNTTYIQENDYDAIVVGSDQIWRPIYTPSLSDAYLEFAKTWSHVKRISYAASFGTDTWEYDSCQTETCAKLLKLFDAVSVREFSGIELCKRYFHVHAVQMLDPTLLLTRDDYLRLADGYDFSGDEHGGLLYYILDETEDKSFIVKRIADANHLKPFRTNGRTENMTVHFEERIQPPVANWIAGFERADYVVTDSFHGCVFSIIFNKPFTAIGNKERGLSRFYSLLSMFGLLDRLVVDSGTHILYDAKIDWKIVNHILDEKRSDSEKFLQKLDV